jgi:hypothetical protein|tara:strand:+ start:1736 stop:1963 length:228 start_codon:yes stop_codon:yes gene_type:complete
MRELTNTLYMSLRCHYKSQVNKALYQLDLAFQKPVAIGEHPKLVDDCVILIKQLSEAEEALETLEKNFGIYKERS